MIKILLPLSYNDICLMCEFFFQSIETVEQKQSQCSKKKIMSFVLLMMIITVGMLISIGTKKSLQIPSNY